MPSINVGTVSSRKTSIGSAAASRDSAIDRFIRGEINVLGGGFGVSQNQIKSILKARKAFEAKQASQIASGVQPGTTVGTLPSTFEQALAQANKKNEERFAQGLDIFKQMQGNVDKFGQTRTEQLTRQLQKQNAADQSSLVDRGLFNSTGVESLQRGRQEDFGFQQTALEEAIAKSRNDILGQQVGFIERRTDAGPDPALFANLQSQASSAPRSSNAISDSFGTGRQPQNQVAGARLVFKGKQETQAGTKPSNSNALSFNDQQTLLGEFARIGFPLNNLTGSQRNAVLREAGITINSLADFKNITREQMNALGRAIQRVTGKGSSGLSPSLVQPRGN